jgi:hypothetical protein
MGRWPDMAEVVIGLMDIKNLNTGEISLKDVRAAFSRVKNVLLEKMENG